MRSVTQLSLALALISSSQPLHAQRPVLSPEAFIQLRTPSGAQISPDGKRVAYVVEERLPERDSVRATLFIVPVTAGASVRVAEGRAPEWSPDSRSIAFTKFDGGTQRVFRVSGSGGASVPVTPNGWQAGAYAWSPDSRRIAATLTRTDSSTNRPSTKLAVIDLATGALTWLATGDRQPADPAWSPNGNEIAFGANGDIFVIAANGGESRAIVERPGVDKQPRWSPDGSSIAFHSEQGQPSRRLRMSVVGVSCRPTACVPKDLGRGSEMRIAGPFARTFFAWSTDGRVLYVPGLWRMTNRLYAIDVASDETRPITQGGRAFWSFSLSADRTAMAFLASDSTSAGDVFVSPLSGSAPRRLTTINPELRRFGLGTPEVVRWKSLDSLEIEGLLLKPRDYRPGRRYPLLIQMEGTYGTYDLSFSGRAIADNNGTFPFQQHVFAAAGYAVLMPNPRGSWGYGDAFSQKGRGDFGSGPVADILTGLDTLIALGIADSTRIGIIGTGYDAYRATLAITQTDRFRAAVIDNPLYDLVELHRSGGQSTAALLEQLIGGSPSTRPDEYAHISPANFADRLRTPTLVSECTGCGFPAQGQLLASALRRNNTPVDTITYGITPSEIAWGPRILLALVRRNLEWFERWIPTSEEKQQAGKPSG
jgi:dipeptidyl aminopeptidase/acylaminoacyl peptidase